MKNIINQIRTCEIFPSFEKAGPRKHIFYKPEKTRVAIVTCGGLCPGLNDVIKGLVSVLNMEYNVSDVFACFFNKSLDNVYSLFFNTI